MMRRGTSISALHDELHLKQDVTHFLLISGDVRPVQNVRPVIGKL